MIYNSAVRVVLGLLVGLTTVAVAARPRWQTLPMPPPIPAPADTGFVTVPGARIYYAVFGKGPPVVLLHGGLGNGDHWSNQIAALADKAQVIAIDSRGQGRSTHDRTAPSYDLMASDVLAVLDHLGIERASIVGWSDGGEIALKLAIDHASRVDKLVVLGANYNEKGAKQHGSGTFDEYAAKCKRDYGKLSATPKRWADTQSWLAPIWRRPMGFTKDQLRKIAAPTLVADGDHDEIIVRSQVEEMAKLIPHAELHIFKDASHFVLWQDPEAVNRVLVHFLAQP